MNEVIIKAVIIEDMADYICTIEMLLKEVAPEVLVAGKASSLHEAEQLFEEISPDVVFLDIQFENEGKTGFDLLDSLNSKRKFNFQLIIITAHIEKQYYAKAFEYKALHFIEKPINKNKLAEAIDRVKHSLVDFRLNSLASKLENEIGVLKSESKLAKINIEGIRYNEIIDTHDIAWIEADGRKSDIYLRNDKKITSTVNIGILEKQLKDFPYFFRINRSEIINLSFVERYSKKEKLVVLKGNTTNHYISRDIFKDFIGKLNTLNLS